jgi:hypothetical protein
MTNTGPLLWNKSSKIQIFTDILYTFCRRLLRPADVTFLKTKNVYQKFIISAFQNYFQTRFYLHISICQSQFIKSISMWDTLYLAHRIQQTTNNKQYIPKLVSTYKLHIVWQIKYFLRTNSTCLVCLFVYFPFFVKANWLENSEFVVLILVVGSSKQYMCNEI